MSRAVEFTIIFVVLGFAVVSGVVLMSGGIR